MQNARQIKRLLVANRGEIAVRIIRAASSLDIETVAVFSDPDQGSQHHRMATASIALVGSSAKDTYLNIEKLLLAAKQCGADAIHPGYGFLAENSVFAQAVIEEGIAFVGPSPELMSLMGDKDRARNAAISAGLPVVPGCAAGLDLQQFKQEAKKLGYPLLIKAVAGGSGRGMRVCESEADLKAKIEEAKAEALAGFGNETVFLEKYINAPRHIEVQVFSDSHGNHRHIFERECSVQRRHQKLIEEAPAPRLHEGLREKILQAAVTLAAAVGYLGAGTVEFLVDGGESAQDPFYFLEMNTRIQVEHPVSEMITGLDLVKEQILVASGQRLSFIDRQLCPQGHAMEFRIYAEDPSCGFSPKTGTVNYLHRPQGLGIREDSWVEAGTRLSPYYDALLSKLIVFGCSRAEVLERAKVALAEYVIEGLETTLEFHRWIIAQEDFKSSRCDVKWIDRCYRGQTKRAQYVGPLVLPPALELVDD